MHEATSSIHVQKLSIFNKLVSCDQQYGMYLSLWVANYIYAEEGCKK